VELWSRGKAELNELMKLLRKVSAGRNEEKLFCERGFLFQENLSSFPISDFIIRGIEFSLESSKYASPYFGSVNNGYIKYTDALPLIYIRLIRVSAKGRKS